MKQSEPNFTDGDLLAIWCAPSVALSVIISCSLAWEGLAVLILPSLVLPLAAGVVGGVMFHRRQGRQFLEEGIYPPPSGALARSLGMALMGTLVSVVLFAVVGLIGTGIWYWLAPTLAGF